MAYRLIVKFPFQSVNDEQYILMLHAQGKNAYTAATEAMNADSECFKHVSTYTDDKYEVEEYEGMLCGSVKAEDDSRDDLFSPLAPSKLKFAIACQQFPTWLMDLCNDARNVKVVLYAVTTLSNPKRERWRGYLVANTLNMTVVNNLMACPLTAVDEIGVAKYLPFRANCTGRPAYLTLYQLMKKWWQMQWAMFNQVYTDANLATNQAALYWYRNIAVDLSDLSQESDILNTAIINLERYYIDKDATWQNVLSDLCQYLGVHFVIGGYGTNHNYDNYILAGYDGGTFLNYVYAFHTDTVTSTSAVWHAELGNPRKVGADLQITVDPDEWKGAKVMSTPERPPKHEYLDEANMKTIAAISGDNFVECRIGQQGAGAAPLHAPQLKRWRFQHAQIVTAKEQWTEEADYIVLEDCQVSSEGCAVGASGYFPYTNHPASRTKPSAADVADLEFVCEKKGMIAVKIGSFDFVGATWPSLMSNYLMLLNNVWGRKYWYDDEPVDTDTTTPFKVATLFPFGLDASVLTAGTAYLAINFDALFLNENIGKAAGIVEYDDANSTYITDLSGRNSVIFPMTEAINDYGNGQDNVYGALHGGAPNRVIYASPFLTCRLRIGNWFYTYDWDDPSLRGWTYYADPTQAPTFRLPVNNADVEYWDLTTIQAPAILNVDDYYYNSSNPKSRIVEKAFYVPLAGLSLHEKELAGRVELEIYWPTPYLNYYQPEGTTAKRYNNILSVLINNIDITFTDEAEIKGTDIEQVAKTVTDSTSATKEMKELTLNLATATVEGVFNNCLLYDDGAEYKYIRSVRHQGDVLALTPEKDLANKMALLYNRPAMWVELRREFAAANYGNVANLEFRVSGLTEAVGNFVPVQRSFDFTKGWVKWKLQQLDANVFTSRVLYLESNGSQYIDTGVVPDDDTGMMAYCEYVNNGMDVAGLLEGTSGFIVGVSNVASYGYWGGYKNGIAFSKGTILLNYANSRKFQVTEYGGNSYDTALTTLPFTPTTSIMVFGFNHDGVADGKATRLYSLKITQGNDVIHDFVPVRVKTVGYLYDQVTGQLYGNQGSGAFTLGPDV